MGHHGQTDAEPDVEVAGPMQRFGPLPLIGGIAGAISALVFTVIHQLWISNIWFSFVPMLFAGILCGACVCWTYGRLAKKSSVRSWLTYNLAIVLMFVLLGIVSVIMFEPQTTIAALVAANDMPSELIGEALPLTVVFTLLAAGLPVLLFRSRWTIYFASLATTVLLVLTLGLNVSIIGLVDIPGSSLYLVFELFGLIAVLDAVFAGLVAAFPFRRKRGAHSTA